MSPSPKESSESIFDLSLIQDHPREHRKGSFSSSYTLAQKSNTAVLSPAESYDSLPHLDCLTSEETNIADDDSSVSTLGSTRSVSTSSKRTVFPKYWNVTGQKPLVLRKRIESTTSSSSSSVSTSSHSRRRPIIFAASVASQQQQQQDDSFESLPLRTTSVVQEGGPRHFEERRRTRSMFDLGSLDETLNPSSSSSSSSSHHRSRTRASCLKKRDRFYSADRKGSNSCGSLCLTLYEEEQLQHDDQYHQQHQHDDSASITSSVRFDLDATDVRLYQTPIEVHADEGWAGFFH